MNGSSGGFSAGSGVEVDHGPRLSAIGVVLALVSAGIVAVSLTTLFLTMRRLMETVGGFSAIGGPYVIANQAPSWSWLIFVCVFTMLAAVALGGIGARRGWGVGLGLLTWSATFVVLGWNFLSLGLDPPPRLQGAWAWILCGVVFWIMGLWPALLLIRPFRRGFQELLSAQSTDAQRFWRLPDFAHTARGYLVAQLIGALLGIAGGISAFVAVVGA